MVKCFIILFIILLSLTLWLYWETLKINTMVYIIVRRGILAPDCKWWGISDALLKDASGIDFYNTLKTRYGKIAPINIYGTKLYLVMNIDYIKQILDNSPFIFGVGKLKLNMFKSFMSDNVGVSEGCPWMRRRIFNEAVLDNPTSPRNYINKLLSETFPTNYQEFSIIAKKLSYYIVFGDKPDSPPNIYDIFSEANSISAVWYGTDPISPETRAQYDAVLDKYVNSPIPGSLVDIAVRVAPKYINHKELLHQIPHWMFPIVGLPTTSFLRLLLLLCNDRPRFEKLVIEIKSGSETYLRKCILETLRLNNPVVSTFRTLLQDYSFNGVEYTKGSQFLILNNPVLRDPTYFSNPNKFLPERWDDQMEDSYYSIMFNQGPQSCPGKELAIQILKDFTIEYLTVSGTNIECNKTIDTNDVPQMMSPCNIEFYSTTNNG